MYVPNNPLKVNIVPFVNLIKRSLWRRCFLVGVPALTLSWFALSPAVGALDPPPDGGYPGSNTAEGDGALDSVTNGSQDTAIGAGALASDTDGAFNTAVGASALVNNTIGSNNTAIGLQALGSNITGNNNTASGTSALLQNKADNNTADGGAALANNTTGTQNTATGVFALQANNADDNTADGFRALSKNTSGIFNTANGSGALQNNTGGTYNVASGGNALLSNTIGNDNTANGTSALQTNTTGNDNTANGFHALLNNIQGQKNTATGVEALVANTGGLSNTAEGYRALLNNKGSNNVGIGSNAGASLTTGSNNIDIGHVGVPAESGKIRIGKQGTQTASFIAGIYNVNEAGTIKPVYVNSNGQLGTQSPASSRRFKKEIKPMAQTSEAILGLKPVTFQYKSDNIGTPQFGLIAEEVAKLNPDLVVRDDDGEIYTVRYEAVNAMLLNEFIKEHRKVQDLEKQIEALTATVQKVSEKIELNKTTPQLVADRR